MGALGTACAPRAANGLGERLGGAPVWLGSSHASSQGCMGAPAALGAPKAARELLSLPGMPRFRCSPNHNIYNTFGPSCAPNHSIYNTVCILRSKNDKTWRSKSRSCYCELQVAGLGQTGRAGPGQFFFPNKLQGRFAAIMGFPSLGRPISIYFLIIFDPGQPI